MKISVPMLAWGLIVAANGCQAAVRESVATYASGDTQVTLECFVPTAKGKHPVVLLLHGSGGLEQATGAIFRESARSLARKGYVAMVPHLFDSTPQHLLGGRITQEDFAALIAAVADAMAFAATQPEVDAARYAIMGFSMGSNLAVDIAVRDPRVKAVASLSGSYPPFPPDKRLPPRLILHGSKDTSTGVDLVRKYEAALKEQQMPHEIHIYQGIGHNLDAARFKDATERCGKFFNKYIQTSTAPPPKPETAK